MNVLKEIIKQKGDCKGINCFEDKCPFNNPNVVSCRFTVKEMLGDSYMDKLSVNENTLRLAIMLDSKEEVEYDN